MSAGPEPRPGDPAPAPATAQQLWQPIGLARHVATGLLLLTLAALVYGNSLRADFLVDNRVIVLEDPRIRTASAENLSLIATQDYWWPKYTTGAYRPLVTLSYLVNYAVLGNGARPAGYHVVNLLLHAANGVLVYLLALALAGTFWPALWTAALFVTHPIATEAVTNVVGRADLMATLAVLSGVLLHARAARARGWRAGVALGGLVLAAALGVLSKESAVALLGLVVAWDLVYPPATGVRVRGVAAVLLVLLALWVVRTRLAGSLGPPMQPFGDNPLLGAGFWAARATAIKVIGQELWLLLWPRWLSCDYSYNQITLVGPGAPGWENAKAFLAVAAIAALGAVALREQRRRRAISFLIAFFFVSLLPSANLVVLIGSIMAERFLYLPSVAFAGLVTIVVFAAAGRLAPRRARLVASALLGVLALAYGVRAVRRNLDWQDGVRLWASAVRAAPRSFKTHYGLAAALDAGDGPQQASLESRIREDEAALAIIDAKPLPRVYQPSVVPEHLGIDYWTKAERLAIRDGAGDRAARWYEKAAVMLARAAELERVENEDYRTRRRARGQSVDDSRMIGSTTTYAYLGHAYLRLGRHEDAVGAFTQQRGLRPDGADAYRNLARAYAAGEEWEHAAIALLQAFAIAGPDEVVPSLLEAYAHLDGGDCAAAAAPGGRRGLDFDCPLVHAHACRAYGELERIFLAASLRPSAEHVRGQATRYLGCPADAFD